MTNRSFETAPVHESEPSPAGRRARILLVEDSPTEALQLEKVLGSAGYEAVHARNGAEALERLEASAFDLVLSDVRMPGGDGFELCSRLKEEGSPPIVLLTRLGDAGQILRALEAGAHDFLHKRCDGELLLQKIERSLERGRRPRANGDEHPTVIELEGERYEIDADKQQILEFLFSTFDNFRGFEERHSEIDQDRRKVRELAAHLQSVREEERRAVAREIHDELGHQLTALKIELVSLQQQLCPLDREMSARAASMKECFDQVIATIRRISTNLRPGLLDDFGLLAAIEWQTEEFERHTGIRSRLELEAADRDLPPDVSTAVFRILQESLTNVARHAEAKTVEVRLSRPNGSLLLEVEDDGRGVQERGLEEIPSHGIIGMRERALAFGGQFLIGPRREGGTLVRAEIPVRPARTRERCPPLRLSASSGGTAQGVP